jgi:hypothetical protein
LRENERREIANINTFIISQNLDEFRTCQIVLNSTVKF